MAYEFWFYYVFMYLHRTTVLRGIVFFFSQMG